MFPDVHDLTIELVPHVEAYPRGDWTGGDDRRCLGAVEPLAQAAGLPIIDLAELRRPLPDIVERGDWYRLRLRPDFLSMRGCRVESPAEH